MLWLLDKLHILLFNLIVVNNHLKHNYYEALVKETDLFR
jgi:hypothetical protein